MEKLKYILKQINYNKAGFWISIGADLLYIVDIIWCIFSYSRIDTSNYEGQYVKENGLINYIIEHITEPVLFRICLFFLMIAAALLIVAYILEKDGVKKIVVAGASVTIVVSVIMLVILNAKSMISLRINLLGQIIIPISWINIVIWTIVCLVLLVVEKETRKTALVFLGSSIWIALGAFLLLASTCGLVMWLAVKFANLLFSGSSGRVIEEKDEYGNVIRRWREEL